ncbi:MAG: HAD-IIB family hydrolase [Pseudomonadales bacterium]|nr:HAD-IIB family hydrolase [Pseudomonadales bacterium]
MTVQMVALDIDGTLLVPGVSVDELPDDRFVRAIGGLQEAGIIVVLATGRMYPGTAYIARHLGIELPVICQQGASVHEKDGTLRHGCSIEESIATDLFTYASQHAWPLAWFDHERYLVTSRVPAAEFFADVSRVEMEVNEAPHLSGVRATGIDIISSVDRSSEVHRFLEARYGPRITLLDFPSVTAIHAPDASKGEAVRIMAEEFGVARDEVLAIGDSVNDVSMLSWAGQSAAPEHCDPYARESAKEILTGVGVDGVIAKLQSLLG